MIIGSGGMGIAAARRVAAGRTLVLADYSKDTLDKAATALSNDGYSPISVTCDIFSGVSVASLAKEAASHGPLDAIIHTAGISPSYPNHNPPKLIYETNILGTSNVIEAFKPYLQVGTAMVCIASMAGHSYISRIPAALQKHFAEAPTSTLLTHPELPDDVDAAAAYGIAKAANILRVQASARTYGEKGARVNTISPGTIYTLMGKKELENSLGGHMQEMISKSALQRCGHVDEIACVVAFLTGPESSFITASDILVDGMTLFFQFKEEEN